MGLAFQGNQCKTLHLSLQLLTFRAANWVWPSVICLTLFSGFILIPAVMPYLVQTQSPRRPDRVRFSEATPAVLRLADGNRASGQLRVVSITGGLLSLPRPIRQGLVAKLMFLTSAGSVLGAAEMLTPLSWELQPFKFVSLPDDDHSRLRSAIKASLEQSKRDQQETMRNANQLEKLRPW